MDLKHPNGGRAKFLETALHQGSYFEDIAGQILDGGARHAMIDAVEKLDDNSAGLTPKQTSILARSGHPTVTDNGSVVHDRAPEVPRLSDEELRAIHSRGVTIHR